MRKSLLLLAGLGTVSLAAAPLPDPSAPPAPEAIARYRELADEGVAQLARRDPERAAAAFSAMEALVPSSAEGPYLLAGALAESGDPEGATRALARALLSGFDDARRMSFDPALRSLRDDPRFQVMILQAESNAAALVDGTAAGAGPPAGSSFESLDALHAHFDALERTAAAWRPVQSPGEHQRLRWAVLDARRAALDRFARRTASDEGRRAELDAAALLGEYRDAPRGWNLEEALRRLRRFLATHPDHALAIRAEWLGLHLRRRALAGVIDPARREADGEELRAELEAFVARHLERKAPEAGYALVDLIALAAASGGDTGPALRTLHTAFAERPEVWDWARREEAALLLRLAGIPDFEATDLDGRARGRRDLLGKVVLIDFWATWCAPCLEQIPDLARLERELAGGGRFLLLGVSIDAAEDLSAEDFDAFLSERGVRWPQIRDGLGEDSPVARAFGLENVPFQVLVGADGSVIAAGPHVDGLAVREAVASLSGS